MRVDLDPTGIVKPLLRKVRQLADLSQAPEGKGGCGECRLVGEMARSLVFIELNIPFLERKEFIKCR
jgi:hypothetical protein